MEAKDPSSTIRGVRQKPKKGSRDMRKIATITTTLMLMLALPTGAAFAAQAIDYGTSAGEVIKGTAEANVIHGLGGDDAIHGMGGNDVLYGGPGNDRLHSTGDGGADYVDCGAGIDTVKKGSGQSLDRFVGCERFVS